MNEIGSKLCKICLNSNTVTELRENPSLNIFFSHVLGIHEPPLRMRLCLWCSSTLRKIMKLIEVAKESHSFLSRMKLNNKEHTSCDFTLSVHHNEHTDIPPSTKERKNKVKNKHKSKKSKIDVTDEKKIKIVTKIKDEQIENEINEIEEVKVEMDMDMADDIDDKCESDDKDEKNIEKPRRQINSKLLAKCEQYNFTLKLLTLEEQKSELEEKKRSEKYVNRKFKCEFCGIGFVTKDVYEEHNERHQESHSRHVCHLCHLRFSTSLVLSQHLLAHERRFTCRLCGATTSRFSDCESHRRKCGQPAPGVCPVCHKIFTNQNSLESHIRGVHYKKEKKFVCSYCNQKFQTKQRLAIHTRTHTGLKPYTCDLCHRSFAANSNLRNHLAAHAQARPHYCVECDKSYKTRKGLRRHLLEGASHVGRKTFGPDLCYRSFAANSNLRNHLAAHAQARPHYCVECDKSYKTRKGLRRHLLEGASHTGRKTHSCHHCLKNFTSEKLLASHISSVHTKPDSCGGQKTFSTTANLKKHIRTENTTIV